MDLVSLNIQRARDHGLPSYAVIREELVGASPIYKYSDLKGKTVTTSTNPTFLDEYLVHSQTELIRIRAVQLDPFRSQAGSRICVKITQKSVELTQSPTVKTSFRNPLSG